MEPSIEKYFERERARPVPEVNVRASVRASLEATVPGADPEAVMDTIANWFSGARGRVFAGAILVVALIAGWMVISQQAYLFQLPSAEDSVTQFINEGDWSQLL